jgi:SAM-dependent methyltransferase
MSLQLSDDIWRVLNCPSCGGTLAKLNDAAECNRCQARYGYSGTGSIDLRLQKPKMFSCEFELGTALIRQQGFAFDTLKMNGSPQVDYSGCAVPHHLTKELLSHFPKAKNKNSLMLDLGCGSGVHREVCERAGFEYVGLDYGSPKAPILGDAHALPFASETFDFILSIAVLEHIRFPFVMMKEVFRVLKPGGIFIGTVSFLEPFHSNSYYHHSHLGTYNSLQEGGFKIKVVCPSAKWSVLMAQARMALFPKMPSALSRLIVLPTHVLHRIWWKIGGLLNKRVTEQSRVTNTSGAFTFIAEK